MFRRRSLEHCPISTTQATPELDGAQARVLAAELLLSQLEGKPVVSQRSASIQGSRRRLDRSKVAAQNPDLCFPVRVPGPAAEHDLLTQLVIAKDRLPSWIIS